MGSLKLVPILLLLASPALAQTYGVGRTPSAEELAASSITISPEGVGLPKGRGTPAEGEKLFVEKGCSGCHGEAAVGGLTAAPNLQAKKGPEVSAWDRGGGANGIPVTVLAEEWHTAPAVLGIDAMLRERGLRDQVQLFWNANNTFGFDCIDWSALQRAAKITTVSRYMRLHMRHRGIDALVIPNGLEPSAFEPIARRDVVARHARAGQDQCRYGAGRCRRKLDPARLRSRSDAP